MRVFDRGIQSRSQSPRVRVALSSGTGNAADQKDPGLWEHPDAEKQMKAQGKIKWKKIHARQLTLKNIHAIWPKKIHTRNLNKRKKFRLENSPPPPRRHNFSNGHPLSLVDLVACVILPTRRRPEAFTRDVLV